MQRLFTVLSVAVVSGFVLTGCPEKKAEKEEPATPDTPAAEAPAEEKKADEKKDEKKDEPAKDKEEGGW